RQRQEGIVLGLGRPERAHAQLFRAPRVGGDLPEVECHEAEIELQRVAHALLIIRLNQISTTAPMIATMIVPMRPPAWTPSRPSSHPPTTAPTMPRTMSITTP